MNLLCTRVRFFLRLSSVLLIAFPMMQPRAVAQEKIKPETTPERQLTLEKMLTLAEENYPGLVADRHAIDAAEYRLKEATYSPFFQWTAQAFVGLAPGATGTPTFSRDSQLPLGNDWNVIAGAQVQGAIPLFTFGKLVNLRQAAKAGVKVSRLQRERSLAELRANVRKAYFASLLAADLDYLLQEANGIVLKAKEEIAERAENDSSVREDATEETANVGEEENLSNPSDMFRLEAAAAELRARHISVKRMASSARAALQTLTGSKSVVVDCPMEKLIWKTPAKSDLLVESALASRPEVAMLAQAAKAKKSEVSIEKARLLPDFALAFSAGITTAPHFTDQDNPFVYDPANQPTLAAALVLRWSLDLVGQTFRLNRVSAEAESLAAKIEEAKRGIALEVELGYQDAMAAEKHVTVWSKATKASRRWMISALQGYQIGAVATDELIDAITKHMEQRALYLQALMELNIAVSELERRTQTRLVADGAWPSHCE